METLEDRLLRGHVTPARDAFAQSAQDVQCGGVRFAIGAPDSADVVDVLGVHGIEMEATVRKLVSHPGLSPVKVSLRAVRALPRAEVRTSARRSSVPGMRPGISVSAERSREWAASFRICTTEVWPRVA